MSPADLLTVTTPLATVHFAGDPSLAATHSSRFSPSNRMMASDGGSAFVRPGAMIAGTGFHTSVSAGFGDAVTGTCATTDEARRASAGTPRNRRMGDLRKFR